MIDFGKIGYTSLRITLSYHINTLVENMKFGHLLGRGHTESFLLFQVWQGVKKTFHFRVLLKALGSRGKDSKIKEFGKEDTKLSLFIDDMLIYYFSNSQQVS